MATVALTLLYGQAVRADDDFHLEEGYCAPYNGKVCKSFISSGQVWYSREDSTGGWENEKITTNLWEELIQGLTGLCREAAEVSSWLALFLYLGWHWHCRWFSFYFFFVAARNCCVHTHFRSVSSKMVPHSSCRCATKTVWRLTSNFATTIGHCWRTKTRRDCICCLAVISGCQTVKNCHNTIDRQSHRCARTLAWPTWIRMKLRVSNVGATLANRCKI